MSRLGGEWHTASELAELKLPGVPGTKRGVALLAERQSWTAHPTWCRRRADGAIEYHVSLLPQEAQAKLAADAVRARLATAPDPVEAKRSALWKRYNRLTNKARERAGKRAEALFAVENLVKTGVSRTMAEQDTALQFGVSVSALRTWRRWCQGLPQCDWLAAVADGNVGRTATADCDPRAWEFLRSDWLRLEAPAFASCYRRLVEAAAVRGWAPIPSAKTLQRRLEKEIPIALRVTAREGLDAAKALYPHQTRDRSLLHALQAVNADGHKFDVFVRWPDGSIGRPIMLAIQDLYSGMFLAWRIDRTENQDLVRLAFGDLLESWGIPDEVTLDNGRAFASKWLTGQTETRFRFKRTADEPVGLLRQLNIAVHWTQPYSGQSKPIERAFRDLAEEVARHPACAGAYTGNRPDAKPESYGSRAVPIEQFEQLVATEVARHNNRPGRRGANAAGRSLAETFSASYETSLVRRITSDQLQMFLLGAEGVTASRRNGEVMLAGNRYWDEALVQHRGQKVVVRFDPQNLHAGVYVYTLAGRLIAEAPCLEAAGFSDTQAAREHARRRKAYLRNCREALRLFQVMSPDQVAALLPGAPDIERPEAKVLRPLFGQLAAPALPAPDPAYEEAMDSLGRALRERHEAQLVPLGDAAGI